MNDEQRATMVQEWGLQDFPKEKQDEYIEQIGRILFESIVLRATATMGEAEQNKLDTFMSTQGAAPDATVAMDYLRQNVPDFDTLVAEESTRLKNIILLPK